MRFKVVCTDIDGTLLDSRRELSDLTIETFQRLPSDLHVILASSRMPSAMTHLQEQLGRRNSPLICYNGGYVIDYSKNVSEPEVLHSTFIDASVCQEIAGMANGTSIHVSLYFADDWYAPRWDEWTEREARITKVDPTIAPASEVIPLWKERGVGGHKVMCMGPADEIREMAEALENRFENAIHVYRSRPTYLEIAAGDISKGSALAMLLERRIGCRPEDVIAFGDNYNDIELLQMAGHGVAVSNARSEVLAVANEVTHDSKEDGVAAALRRHFFGN